MDAMDEQSKRESPTYVRTSTAAAMTMGKLRGRFLRQAQLYCINLLLSYDEGCSANCAYCGLSGSRDAEESWNKQTFIRVDWPTVPLTDVIASMKSVNCSHVERVCISMITNGRSLKDSIKITKDLREVTDKISVLVTPTIINKDWLIELKEAGADKIGVAVDAATPILFNKLRGKGVRGPHRWDRYWRIIEDSILVYGKNNVGIHLVVGLGETEEAMVKVIQRAQDKGAATHLFSFFPEKDSLMENIPQPPIGQYRRVQLARYLINHELSKLESMKFNPEGKITDFGANPETLKKVIGRGDPFMTSGCSGETKECACNRPFGNSTPAQAIKGQLRNFPYELNNDDLEIIKEQLKDYSGIATYPRLDKVQLIG
jgi:biotin synthase